MADDADLAGDNTDKFESEAIKAISKASTRRDLIPCGQCYECRDPVPQHHLFCDGLCSMDWHKRQQRRKDSGQ